LRKRVATEIDLETGITVEEMHLLDGRLHRHPNEGPALIRCDPTTNVVTVEEYHYNGAPHRLNGPAVLHRDGLTGNILAEKYYVNGVLHREGGFALSEIRDGSVGPQEVCSYYLQGKLHRPAAEGPAHVSRHRRSGVVTDEEYWEHGGPHRDPAEGPAITRRSPATGKVIAEEYWWKGRYHRKISDGPALIERTPDGRTVSEAYFANGIRASAPPGRAPGLNQLAPG
jgi:hypothetical protein